MMKVRIGVPVDYLSVRCLAVDAAALLCLFPAPFVLVASQQTPVDVVDV